MKTTFLTSKHLLLLLIVTVMNTVSVFAQKESSLLGIWEVEYEDDDFKATYHLKQEGNEIVGYVISETDKNGQKQKVNKRVIDNIKFDGKSGSMDYSYKGITFDADAKYVDANTIKVSYSVMFLFSVKETWRRKQ